MKNHIITYIKGYLQKLGIYIQYFPTPVHLFTYLQKKSNCARENELKRISETIGLAKNHLYYNSLLKLFVPSWNIKIQEVEFFGEGIGESSLNTFRKVKFDSNYYYEKVYFSSYKELNTINWFQNHAFNLVKQSGINTAKVHKVYYGEFLSIVYFDFLDLKPLTGTESEAKVFEMAERLYRVPLDSIKVNIPDHIKDFKYHFQYQRNVEAAQKRLLAYGMNLQSMEMAINNSKFALTHGDFNEGNIFENNILIDWDSFGIFPVGFEFAYLYYRTQLKYSRHKDFLGWLEQHCKRIAIEDGWQEIRRNFLFFLFVFSCRLFDKEEHNDLEQKLIDVLKVYI